MEEPMTPQTEGAQTQEVQEGMQKKHDPTFRIVIIALAVLIAAALIFFSMMTVNNSGKTGPGTKQGQTGSGSAQTTTSGGDPNSAENINKSNALINYRNKALGLTIDQTIGAYFTEPSTGMTLYVMRTDTGCTGTCLQNFTPYLASQKVSDGWLTTVKRSDSGKLQYAWVGKPLYTYNGDTKPGDVLGDGFGNSAWAIARPQQ